jgi:16S rRNA processing protein RimM
MSVMLLEEWNLIIGEIVAPFGLAGEVKVRLETDFPERFTRLKQVCLRWPTGKAVLHDIVGVRFHKGQVLLKLRGIVSIDAAETLRNALVQVRSDEAVTLPANEYYIHDLLGCEVVTIEGRRLGDVTSVLRSDANDVLVLGQGKDEILLPMVRDVVRHVDIVGRRIQVALTPGLLPGDAEEI